MARETCAGIITYLNTNWVVGTVAKPTFVDLFENAQIHGDHALAVNWSGMQWTPRTTGTASKDEETNTFLIQINAGTLAILNLTIDHARALLKVKTLAGGDYMITSANPMKVGNNYMCFLTLEEVMYLV